jgi:hypothetical protein
MSTYKAIFGKTIKHLSSDPDNSTYEGQIWYNTTEGKFKTVVATEGFSSGANMITARRGVAGAISGSKNSGLGFGGYSGSNAGMNNTEEYNGSGWSTGGNLNKARYALGGAGTQTAGLAVGGFSNPGQDTEVEEYDGTSWTEVTDVPTAKSNYAAALGTQTAALFCGGLPSPTTTTFLYDGTNWTTGGALNTARQTGLQGAGIQTAAVAAGGDVGGSPGVSLATEEYDGTSWTSVNDCPPNIAVSSGSGGTQTDALFMKGTNSAKYDGTSFTTAATMANNFIEKVGNGATAPTTMGFSGRPPSSSTAYTGTTEEYNFTANTVTAGAWASANPQPNAWSNQTGTGNTTSGIIVGGDTGGSFPAWPTQTSEFDGTNWSSGGNYYTAGNKIGFCGGAFSEMMGVGVNKNGPVENTGATYDGSTWTTISTAYPISAAGIWGAGTNTASVWFGGGTGPHGGNPIQTGANSWDGSSWTAETALPASRAMSRSAGTSTAFIAWGATGPSGAPNTSSVEYDGSSWTAGGTNVYNMVSGGQAGTQTAAFGYSPYNSPFVVASKYDGTAWSTMPNMSTSRPTGSGFGTSTSSAIAAGYFPNVGTTEEFTGETTALNIESVDNS